MSSVEKTGTAGRRTIAQRVVNRLRRMVVGAWLQRRVGVQWQHEDADGFSRRSYRSYDDYLLHQRSKLERLDLTEYDRRFREVLRERLRTAELLPKNATVLCLAARLGTEVKAFIDVGCFAIGIDLNPGEDNRYVVKGDFHDLQFASDSVDLVFTNSLDHVFDIDKVVSEARRVLKTGGCFVVEAMKGAADDKKPRFFESFWWDRIDDIVAVFQRHGYVLADRKAIESPWPGEQLWLRKEPGN